VWAFTGTRVAVLVGMMKSLLALPFAAALAACSASGSVTVEPEPGASLAVVNDSDFTIYEIYLTETDNSDWGPNLLRGDVLYPDEELVLGVPCDYYDALIVDEDGVDCEVHDLDLCLNDATWVIRNNTCTVFEAEAARRAAAKL
jgi:hypothetical protein